MTAGNGPLTAGVAITGAGAVTASGAGVGIAWEAVASGLPIRREATFEGYGRYAVGSLADTYAPHRRVPRDIVGSLDAGSLLALDAALQAVEAAGLGDGGGDSRRFAVVDGIAFRAPGQAVLFAPYGQTIARVLGVRGPVLEVAGAEASGALAVVTGARLVAGGDVDVAIVGAGQALQGQVVAHLDSLSLLAGEAARPFDRDHDGCFPAEGAAFLVLEAEARARARGREPLAILEGAAQLFDPTVEPLAVATAAAAGRSQQAALAAAGAVQNQIDLIVSCADGRPEVDFGDAYGVRRIFGDHAYYMPITGAAGTLGQTFAASGPLSLVLAVEALRRQTVFPLSGFRAGEPDLELSYASGLRQDVPLDRVLVTSLGLGGACAAFVVRRTS